MRKKLSTFLELVAQAKVYFSNASLYLSIANFIMILATFKLAYHIDISAFILVPVGFVGVLIIGYFDYKIISLRQIRYINQKNDLKLQLDRIEKKLETLEKQGKKTK